MSDTEQPQTQKARRWREVGTTLQCQCGERFASLDEMTGVDWEKHRLDRRIEARRIAYPKPPAGPKPDKTLIRETLLSFCDEQQRFDLQQTMTEEEMARHFRTKYKLCIRLDFLKVTLGSVLSSGATPKKMAQLNSSGRGTNEIRGRCWECKLRHGSSDRLPRRTVDTLD